MILFPAIDLKDGHCVRLEQGDMQRATVFGTDPGAQARAFAKEGFEYLHVVDLNGAFAGRAVNGDAVAAAADPAPSATNVLAFTAMSTVFDSAGFSSTVCTGESSASSSTRTSYVPAGRL